MIKQRTITLVLLGLLLLITAITVPLSRRPMPSTGAYATIISPSPVTTDPRLQPSHSKKEYDQYLQHLKPKRELTIQSADQLEPMPQQPDIDVTYISRTPRYYRYCLQYNNDIPFLCPGTENQKRWPGVGESVTYTAHLLNKGTTFNGNVRYEWKVDGVIKNTATIAVNMPRHNEKIVTFQNAFPSQNQSITFSVQPVVATTEINTTNNMLSIGSHDLTLSYWVEQGFYDAFNNTKNTMGSYSFEDWVRLHIEGLNTKLRQSKYSPTAARGVFDQIRIDKFIIAPELDGSGSPLENDPDRDVIDGMWRTTDNDPTNQNGANGFIQSYLNTYIGQLDLGLLHEIGHQIGLPDLYHMRLPIAPPNNGIQIKSIENRLVTKERLPNGGEATPYFDLMGGGDIRPYTDHSLFSTHSVFGLNTNKWKRRGFFAEYYYDTPVTTRLLVKNSSNQIISNATVQLFQRDPHTELFDNTAEFSGTTNSSGIVTLTNRPVTPVTTATGHTLKPNPWGQINVVGTNGTMIAKVTKNNQEGYAFLQLHDANIAYWKGETGTATIDLLSNFPLPILLPDNFQALYPIDNESVNSSQVQFKWSLSNGATSYEWKIFQADGTSYKNGTTSATSETVTLPAGNYRWQLTAKNSAGSKKIPLEEFRIPFSKIRPLANSQIIYGTNQRFEWRPVHPVYGKISFVIYDSNNRSAYSKVLDISSGEFQSGKFNVLLSSQTNSDLVKGKTYTWQISAKSAGGLTPPTDSTGVPQKFTLK